MTTITMHKLLKLLIPFDEIGVSIVSDADDDIFPIDYYY